MFLFVPSILSQTANIFEELPKNVNTFINKNIEGTKFLDEFYNTIGISEDSKNEFNKTIFSKENSLKTGISISGFLKNVLVSFLSAALNFFLILIFSFYFSVRNHSLENFIKIITPARYTKYATGLWLRSQKKIGLWIKAQLFFAVVMSVICYIGLYLIGFENPLPFAILSGLGELIPLIGAILAGIPAIIVGFFEGGFIVMITVLVFYLILQNIGAYFINPKIMNKVVGIPVIVVVISVIVGGQLFGFLGIILAVPLSAVLMEFISDIEKRQEILLKKGETEEFNLKKNV